MATSSAKKAKKPAAKPAKTVKAAKPAKAPVFADPIDALFAAVAANPDDVASYLVLADALEQKGDPRAELMQLQVRLATDRTDELLAKEQKLITARRKAVLGKLAGNKNVELEFRFGLLEAVKVASPAKPEEMGNALVAVFQAPDASTLRKVAIVPGDDGSLDDYGDPDAEEDEPKIEELGAVENCVDTVLSTIANAKATPPASLRTVELGRAFDRDRGFRVFSDPWSRTGDNLSQVLTVFPEIEELRIDLGPLYLTWAPLVSKRLKRFTLITPYTSDEEATVIAKSKLPALEAFTMWTGGELMCSYDYEAEEAELQESMSEKTYKALFDMLEKCPDLRELGFPNNHGDAVPLLDKVAKRACGKTIEVVDLSWTAIGDGEAKTLVTALQKFPKLRELRLEGSDVSAGATKAFAKAKIPTVGNPPKGTKRYHYVVTME